MDVRHGDVIHIFQLRINRYDIFVKRTEPQRVVFPSSKTQSRARIKLNRGRMFLFRACTRGERFPWAISAVCCCHPASSPPWCSRCFCFIRIHPLVSVLVVAALLLPVRTARRVFTKCCCTPRRVEYANYNWWGERGWSACARRVVGGAHAARVSIAPATSITLAC